VIKMLIKSDVKHTLTGERFIIPDMTESARLSALLLDLIDRVKHRGSSTKLLWMNFSKGAAVPRAAFDQLAGAYGLPFRPGDLDVIWANIGVKGSTMTYPDFVRFITMDRIDPSIGAPRAAPPASAPPRGAADHYADAPPRANPPRRRGASLSEVLASQRAAVGRDLIALDPGFTGFVSTFDFELIVQRVGSVDPAEVQRLAAAYDPRGAGSFNYFTLLSDVCNQLADEPPLRAPDPRAQFADPFEMPPAQRRRAEAPPPAAYAGEPRPRASRADEIIRTIASRMTEVFDSSGNCFNKWRGYARTVGPTEFVAGAKRDFNIEMTLEEAQEIIDRFSGTLTLGTFLKMVGAGADAASAQVKAVRLTELDENEKTLLHIARQAKNKDWEGVFEAGNTAEHIVMGLKRLSIYVLGADLQPCITKYGKPKVMEKIREFIAGL
jgi:hypothetical protein